MKEQILALAVQSGFKLDWAILNCTGQFESFYHAAIESYKAELLKEVGEPVAFLHQWIEYHPYGDTVAGEPCSAITNDGKPFDKSDTVTTLFTSDQVAAAVLKATKPLEERIKWLQDFTNKDGEVIKILEDQLTAAQEEIAFQKSAHEQAQQLLLEQGDQLAKAEQRVAEACALQVATETKLHWLDAARVAKEIRSGEWRKFVKEVL